MHSFDIICPAYYPKNMNEVDGVIQNTLPVGNCSVGDMRQIVQANQRPGKVWAEAVIPQQSTNSTSFVPMSKASVSVKSPGARFDIFFDASIFSNPGTAVAVYTAINIDGVPFRNDLTAPAVSNTYSGPIMSRKSVYLPAGFHTIYLSWKVGSAVLVDVFAGILTVEER
jgi:hypothetical protein